MKIIKAISWTAVIIVTLLTFIACQDVFTFSPFSGLQRDPAKLSDEMKVSYATNALAGGSQDSMSEAYTLINDMLTNDGDNGELQLLAADLAMGASGISDAVSDLIGSLGSDSAIENIDPNDIVSGLDSDMLGAVSTHIDAAESTGTTPTNSQYVNAGAALVAKEAKDAGGFENIDWENPSENIQKAQDYAEKGDIDIESFFGGF
jgi:hypothetical protein